jgi:plasmid stabilization system protein ParE
MALRFPLLGEATDQLRLGSRRLIVGNYQLFYEQTSDGIRLLRVYHAARRIEDLFD